MSIDETTFWVKARKDNMGFPRWIPWWLFLGLRTGLIPAVIFAMWWLVLYVR